MKDHANEISQVIAKVPAAALFEQLAEECTELAHAALKYARIIRHENPTPVSVSEALGKLREEYSDVELSAEIVGLISSDYQMDVKLNRMLNRIAMMNNDEDDRTETGLLEEE